MSRGIGAIAELVLQDEDSVLYEYGSYNLNDKRYENRNNIRDGFISIQKDCFVEPKRHEKIKRMPSGRKKLVVKRIPAEVDYIRLLVDKKIVVENCSNCWKTSNDDWHLDIMVFSLLSRIFLKYQEIGCIPEIIGIHK